ncbi:MAG TPA: GNAT family N-acetyltransferase [Terriglobales bacterium]|nr:GNAT family N-acetyltransferase [Terriglobales bacterium]
MQFVDQAFARRLESAEEIPQVDCVRMFQKLRPEVGAAFEPFCGGHMMFAGLNSPIGHAAGLGFDGPVTSADLDRLEAFYRSHGAPAQLDLCPLTDPSVFELVTARGYAIAELNNVLFANLDSQQSVDVPSGVEIRRSSAAEADVFSDIVSRSFFDKGDPPEGFADMLAPLFHFPEALTFLATVDGEPVAGAAGRIIPEHRVFALFGAGTLPDFRGRGIQTALLRTRMKAAADAGCELVVVVTRGGSVSERNCIRLGFQIAYSKATVIKRWDGCDK